MNTPGKLTPALFPSATRLLADAFSTNPAHVYICPDLQRRRQQLEWLLGGNPRMQPDLDYSFCLANESEVQAMGFWTRSNGPRASRLQRGTGIGTRLLAEQLSIVAQAEPSFPLALTTQRPENVVFYERLGFRIMIDQIVGSGPPAFRNWVMAHPPAA